MVFRQRPGSSRRIWPDAAAKLCCSHSPRVEAKCSPKFSARTADFGRDLASILGLQHGPKTCSARARSFAAVAALKTPDKYDKIRYSEITPQFSIPGELRKSRDSEEPLRNHAKIIPIPGKNDFLRKSRGFRGTIPKSLHSWGSRSDFGVGVGVISEWRRFELPNAE